MTTNNKQQTNATILKQIAKDFNILKTSGNKIYIDIETEGKVKKLERLKDYLNNNTRLYILSICFGGGDSLQQYTTIAKIEIIEGLTF